MPKPKIHRLQLPRMLQMGMSQKEIAQFFHVSEAAVSQAIKELNLHVVKAVALERAHEVTGQYLDTVSQLQGINQKTNLIFDGLMKEIEKGGATREAKKDLREIALKASQEIRGQLSLQLEIFKTLTDVTAIAEFQKEVITKIGESNTCPECHSEEIICGKCGTRVNVRTRIIEGLKQARALRAGVQFRPEP